jgi:predicted MFS family arabinose efflux permease
VLIIVYLVNFMDRQLFAVLQESIRADLNLSDSQLALLGGTMFAIFYATMGVPIAWAADRTNRVRLIAIACAVWSLFTALSGLATNFFQMALARIGVATGEAGGVAPSYSVISDYFPPSRRGLAIGLFTIGAPLGLMAGTFLGAWIADALSWRWAFILLGLPGLLLAVGLVLIVKEPKRGALDAPAQSDAPAPKPLEAVRVVLCTPTLLLLTLGAAATSFAGYGLYQWIPSFLQRSQGLSLDDVRIFLSPLFLLGILGAIGGGWIADRLGKTRPSAYAFVPAISIGVSAPFFLAAMLVTDGGLSLMLLAIPIMLGYAWLGPGLAAAQTLTRPAMRATMAAIIGLFNNLIGIGLGPLFIGFISDSLAPSIGEGEALRIALACGVAVFLLAAGLFAAAGVTLKRDLDRMSQA